MRQQKVTIIKSYERERERDMKNEQNSMEWATFYMDSHKKNFINQTSFADCFILVNHGQYVYIQFLKLNPFFEISCILFSSSED